MVVTLYWCNVVIFILLALSSVSFSRFQITLAVESNLHSSCARNIRCLFNCGLCGLSIQIANKFRWFSRSLAYACKCVDLVTLRAISVVYLEQRESARWERSSCFSYRDLEERDLIQLGRGDWRLSVVVEAIGTDRTLLIQLK